MWNRVHPFYLALVLQSKLLFCIYNFHLLHLFLINLKSYKNQICMLKIKPSIAKKRRSPRSQMILRAQKKTFYAVFAVFVANRQLK